MDAPPIQYVTTKDGVRIAYTVSGDGFPFVRMPFPFNNLRRMWRQPSDLSLFEALSRRFRLVQYDSRGVGQSERNLPDNHTYEDYRLDLEAVLERLELERFILFASLLGGHTALRYAAQHPDRVVALVLHLATVGNPLAGLVQFEEMAANSWENFLFIISQANRRPGEKDVTDSRRDYYTEAITQADFLKMIRCGQQSSVDAILGAVVCPTLLLTLASITRSEEDAERLASLLPNARIVAFDLPFTADMYTLDGSEPPIISAIDEFLAQLPDRSLQGQAETFLGLSKRETEVLRLIAQRKSNPQIAEELVISLNTVQHHVSNILGKTGAVNRTEAAAYAHREGIA
jgi:pimeloyl-ACP methyl ester carboxylesterase/DNA-binding CsgD family transcriptional regulator